VLRPGQAEARLDSTRARASRAPRARRVEQVRLRACLTMKELGWSPGSERARPRFSSTRTVVERLYWSTRSASRFHASSITNLESVSRDFEQPLRSMGARTAAPRPARFAFLASTARAAARGDDAVRGELGRLPARRMSSARRAGAYVRPGRRSGEARSPRVPARGSRRILPDRRTSRAARSAFGSMVAPRVGPGRARQGLGSNAALWPFEQLQEVEQVQSPLHSAPAVSAHRRTMSGGLAAGLALRERRKLQASLRRLSFGFDQQARETNGLPGIVHPSSDRGQSMALGRSARRPRSKASALIWRSGGASSQGRVRGSSTPAPCNESSRSVRSERRISGSACSAARRGRRACRARWHGPAACDPLVPRAGRSKRGWSCRGRCERAPPVRRPFAARARVDTAVTPSM